MSEKNTNRNCRLVTAEAVRAGHPDKFCDQLADRLLDEYLKDDPNTRAAIEVMAADGKILVAGEVTSEATVDVERVLKELEHRGTDRYINISSKSGFKRIALSGLMCVEVINHDLIFHSSEGCVRTRGTMKKLAEELKSDYFVMCSNCYLVNLAHVKQADRSVVLSDGTELTISRNARKGFFAELAKYLGGTI